MKKIIAIALALVLTLALAVTCLAALENPAPNAVKATYSAGAGTATVHKVDVSFGSMAFTYTEGNLGTWDPEDHAYENPVAGAWTCDQNANKVTVTNHSNAAVTVAISYEAADGFDGITGTIGSGTTLPSAVGKATDAADLTYTATLTLEGALASGTAANTTIGTVTVALS